MSSKKRLSPSSSSSSKSKRKKSTSSSSSPAPSSSASLFRTLALLEHDDDRAAKRRTHRAASEHAKSRSAADQVAIGRTLLEMRILLQRSFAELEGRDRGVDGGDGDDSDGGAGAGDAVAEEELEEVDALLENLLAARRDLAAHALGSGDDDDSNGGESPREGAAPEGPDYASLIEKENKGGGEDGSEEGNSDGAGKDGPLGPTLQKEYDAIKSSWRTVLDRRHRDLQQLHSGPGRGGGSSSSRFSGAVVDAGFWDQVEGSARHDKFHRSTGASNGGNDVPSSLAFDDARLYQRMLQDFISSASNTSSSSGRGNVDPSREAASRLKRATRKSDNGIDGVDDDDVGTGVVAIRTTTTKNTGVDRRASKGRKIRYAIHAKLVNFSFPVRRSEPTIEEDAWFDSLFGGVGRASS